MKDKVKLFYLCMVLFIDAIGSGLVLPILPELYLNRQYGLLKGGDPHYTNIIYGVTLALFPLASLFGKYFFGALSDHFGRKKTIIVGLGLTLLSYLLSMVAVLLNNVWLFIFARFVTGFGTGTYTAVFAMIADVSKTLESKLNNFKWPALATVLGFIIGPILGGSFGFSHGQMAFIIPFVIGFLLTLVNIYRAKTSLDETFVIQGDSSFNTFFY
ncbi:MFS transporter, partial [Salmonella enterica]|nr:MFS transporter [Salmonella enterica]